MNIKDFIINGTTLVKYIGHDYSVKVPNGITIIGEGCFDNNNYIVLVTLPDGLKSIKNRAFYECFHLKQINIPDTLNYIGRWAFSACHNLKSLIIPNSIHDIDYCAFEYCYKLELQLPDNYRKNPIKKSQILGMGLNNEQLKNIF
jgi:hypothetical protein